MHLEEIRRQYPNIDLRESVLQSIIMLLADKEHLLSHFIMVAERREPPRPQQRHGMTPSVLS